MKLETFSYTKEDGWSIETFPDLDSEQTLILIFAAPEMIQDLTPLQELSRKYPLSKMMGCSSAGEIYGSQIRDNSLSVAIARFEHTPLQIVKANLTNMEKSFTTAEQVAQQLKRTDLKGVLVLSEGLLVNGSELVKGLSSVLGESVVITGGLAGDGVQYKDTWTIYEGEILKNHIIAVGFYGDHVQMGWASRGGWDIFGPERYITRSKGNILYELDGKPALELYKQYLGEKSTGLPATGLFFPLSIRANESDEKQLVRTISAVTDLHGKELTLKRKDVS